METREAGARSDRGWVRCRVAMWGRCQRRDFRVVRMRRGDITREGAPCILASLKEVLVLPTPTPTSQAPQ